MEFKLIKTNPYLVFNVSFLIYLVEFKQSRCMSLGLKGIPFLIYLVEFKLFHKNILGENSLSNKFLIYLVEFKHKLFPKYLIVTEMVPNLPCGI